MADSDWSSYKQLRGQELPEQIPFRGCTYQRVTHFKRDFYAATGLYELHSNPTGAAVPDKIVLKIYHQAPWCKIPLGWLGRMLANRELYYQTKVLGIPNVVQVLERFGETGFIREYIPGCHLREYRKTGNLPTKEFYLRLEQALTAIHAQGFSHNDLSKAENILVDQQGMPVIIDFQIAHCFSSRLRPLHHLLRKVLGYMQSVDCYHLRKHRMKDRPQDFTNEELTAKNQKGFLLRLHANLIRKPYRAVRHAVVLPLIKNKARV
ncbi:MAG: hypothetical protein R3B84_19285 [Zavarzinella sp.]